MSCTEFRNAQSGRIQDEVIALLKMLKTRVDGKLSLIDAGETHGERLDENHLANTSMKLEELIEGVENLDMSYAENPY